MTANFDFVHGVALYFHPDLTDKEFSDLSEKFGETFNLKHVKVHLIINNKKPAIVIGQKFKCFRKPIFREKKCDSHRCKPLASFVKKFIKTLSKKRSFTYSRRGYFMLVDQ